MWSSLLLGALTQNQVHPLLGSLPLSSRPLQSPAHPHLERFLPLRVNGSSPLSLFPNFNAVRCQKHFWKLHDIKIQKLFAAAAPAGKSCRFIFQMDPVQKAVINHTFGVAQQKKKPIISCNICHLRFNSTVSHTLLFFPSWQRHLNWGVGKPLKAEKLNFTAKSLEISHLLSAKCNQNFIIRI